jgi:VCBS repeat-containing protein
VIELTLVRSGNSVTVKATLLDNFDTHTGGPGLDDLANLGTVEVIARDIDGDEAKNVVTVTISDDIPVANDDAFTVLEGGPTSIDLTVRANDVNGADGFDSINFPVVTGTYGSITFKLDGTPVYTLSTSGAAALQALGNDQTLTETFTYTLKDSDNDTDPAQVVITLRGTDDPVTITNLTPTANGGDALVDEDDLPNGSDTNKESTTGTGDFNISAPDGLGTLKVAGFDLFVNGQFVVNSGGTTPLGNTIRFTAFDPATGKVSYTYTLNAAETHVNAAGENFLFEELPVVLTDRDGSTANGVLSVKIVDDIAKANDDLGYEILEGGANFINFDVDTNDVPGADGTGSRLFTSLTGNFGTLTLNADGTQTYTLTAAGQAVIDALAPGQTRTDSFSYTLTDADGDSSSANVLVTLRGTDDPVTITNLTPAAQGGDASADEDDLPAGSDASKESLTTTGNFTISAPDGVDDLTVGGIAVIVNGVFQSGATGTTPEGHTIAFTGYNAATGVVSYSYTLLFREAHPAGAGENNLFDNLPVVLTDEDGDQATDTLSIRIIDDVPSVAVTTATEPNLTVDESSLGIDATGSFAGAFAALYGADGAAATNPLTYALNVSAAGAASGLVDSATGNGIFLFKVGNNVVGKVGATSAAADSGSTVAFVLSVSANGTVTLDQQRAVSHSPNSGPDQSISLASDNLVTISATATDADGDSATSAGVGIGSNLVFKDDVGSLGTFSGTTVPNNTGASGTGTFDYNQGADTHGSFAITGTAPAGIINTTVQNAAGALLTGTSGSTTIYTLQVNIDGTYKFTLVTPEAAKTTSVSLLNIGASGPEPFKETADFKVEFTGSGNGVNSSTQGFGVNNQTVENGESFTIEFKNIGQIGNQGPGVDARYVSSATLFADNVNGLLTFTAKFIDSATGLSETKTYTITEAQQNTSVLLDPNTLNEFDRIEIVGIGGPANQGVRFVRLEYTETILPADLNLVFNVQAVDKDGDVTLARVINVAVDATPPVVLDLDGDGFAFRSVENGVAYDYNGDGRPELTAWVGPKDGILVHDANGNGIVDNASEFVFGARGMSDMQALAARYGAVLDKNDADYAKFGVWIDANSDGRFDAGEYQTLADAKIASIGLVSNGVNSNAAGGDVHISGVSKFTREDGTTGDAADAAFRIVRGNPQPGQAIANSNVGLVSIAAAAAALAALPAAAKPIGAGESLREHGDSSVLQIRPASPQANEAAAGSSGLGDAAPVLDHATPQANVAEPVQHFGGAQQVGLDSVEPVSTASGSEHLDQGTELVAAHAPAFFTGGGEISLPAPAEMAALAAIGQAGSEAQAQATVAQVLSDALSGGNAGADIDMLLDAAVSLARDSGGIGPAANDGGPALGDQLASPLAATVPGWDAGHSGPLFAGHAAAMETHALHPDAVQAVANG